MPIALNGNYYTTKELADEIGIHYTSLSRKITGRQGIISLGQTSLIPEALGKLIAKEINYGQYKNTTAISTLAQRLSIQVISLEEIVSYGLPVEVYNGKKRIKNECVPFLIQAIKEIIEQYKIFPRDQAHACYLRTMELMEQSKND